MLKNDLHQGHRGHTEHRGSHRHTHVKNTQILNHSQHNVLWLHLHSEATCLVKNHA